jgi:hypothetical protein
MSEDAAEMAPAPTKITGADGQSRKVLVVVDNYLKQIYQASKALARRYNNEDDDEDTLMEIDVDNDSNNSNLSPDAYVDRIAETLVTACSPETLSLGVSHLPPLNIFDFDETTDAIEDDEGNDLRDQFYQHRRADYLRRLVKYQSIFRCTTAEAATATTSVSNRSHSAVISLARGGTTSDAHGNRILASPIE